MLTGADGSLHIIPALNLVDKKQKIDCKWSLSDITYFPKHPQSPEARPTTIVWWQTSDSNQNAIVGYDNSRLALISLTDGRCLNCCGISEPIKEMILCQDSTLDCVSLLVCLLKSLGVSVLWAFCCRLMEKAVINGVWYSSSILLGTCGLRNLCKQTRPATRSCTIWSRWAWTSWRPWSNDLAKPEVQDVIVTLAIQLVTLYPQIPLSPFLNAYLT